VSAGKAGLSDAPLKGRVLVLPTNNRLGRKSFLGANIVAFLKKICNLRPYNILSVSEFPPSDGIFIHLII
jgi:hypothetical protein